MTERRASAYTEGESLIADAYRHHAAALIRFATVLVGPDEAQDVVAAALVRVLGRQPASITSLKGYLYQAVANQARNHLRGESRRRNRESHALHAAGPVFQPEPHPEVRAAVERLSVRQRAVVYLTYWEDMTDEAVAQHLGIGAGSVRRHLARARRHLRGALDERDG